jgi:UDP-N-acetyl-2-amino-2-deoxyglucuronate dehydrogenase
LKEAYDEGRFGKITLATVRLRWCREQAYYEDGWHGTWKMDGGVISQQAFHHIDALQWICGRPSSVVAAQTNSINQLEAEDTMVATIKFLDGALGVIEATTAARPRDFEASLSLVGEKGLVLIGGIALNKIEMWEFVNSRSEDITIPSDFSEEVPTGYGLSHGRLIQEIVDRLSKGNINPPISGSDALPAVELVHALYRSVETANWVDLEDHPLSARLGR